MCSNVKYPRLGLGLTAILSLIAGQAGAQVAANCPNYVTGDATTGAYCINGSDTLFDIMTAAIKNKVAQDKACTLASNCVAATILQGTTGAALNRSALFYNGTGSGNGENSMKAGGAAAGGGAFTGGLGTQSIAPMSRNFRPATVSAYPSWQPQVQNVLGLDAAVIVTRNTSGRFKNFSLTPLASDSTKATPNTASLPITFGVQGSGYDQLLEVILSGIDGSGTTAACADPRRVQAISDFSALNGGNIIRHFYRRDENSGTTDTFKDKIAVGRFCNGNAFGVLGPNKVHPNLNNQDLDPIRRPCDAPIAGVREQVTCTDLTTGALCTSGATCTQGLVTALSENDPGITDYTVSIAKRVEGDNTGATVGYAGREAIRQASGLTAGPFINTVPPTDVLVRQDSYMLSRRLFLNRGPAIVARDSGTALGFTFDPASNNYRTANGSGALGTCATGTTCNERVQNTNTANNSLPCPDGSANKCTGGGVTQRGFEDALFNYMTDPDGGGSQDGNQGRCNVDPIVKQFGFLTCLDDCTLTPSGGANLCSKTPYTNPASAPAACIPQGTTDTTANLKILWDFSAVTTPASGVCCSNGAAVAANGTCAAANAGRAINSACSADQVQAECASGLTCTDIGGGLLACQ